MGIGPKFFWPFFIQNRHNVTAINRLKLFIHVVTLITELGQVFSVLRKKTNKLRCKQKKLKNTKAIKLKKSHKIGKNYSCKDKLGNLPPLKYFIVHQPIVSLNYK